MNRNMDNLSNFFILLSFFLGVWNNLQVSIGKLALAANTYLSSFMENLKLQLSSIGKFEAAFDISLPNRYLNVA